MALRLRYSDKSIVLSTGQIVVGRSVECNLVVNDPLASRRHAVITMSKTGAFVADLGSKAGVVVNGVMISGARKLATGDTIQLASVRIVVEDAEGDEPEDPRLRTTLSPPAYATVPAGFRLAPTPPLGLSRVETYRHGEALIDDEEPTDFARTLEAPRVALPPEPAPRPAAAAVTGPRAPAPDSSPDRRTAPAPESGEGDRRTAPAPEANERPSGEVSVARIAKLPPLPSFARPDNLRALATVAEKALALNRAEEAERVAQRALLETMDAARRGEVDAPTAEVAATLAAKLAAALGAGRWFDYAVELYGVRSDFMPAPVVDQLLEAVRKAKPIDKPAFRRYLAGARGSAGDSPARRFVLQRLEGVQRLLDLK